jgi:hypothetical protein
MKYIEPILSFLLALATLFWGKKKGCVCPADSDHSTIAPDAGDGGDDSRLRCADDADKPAETAPINPLPLLGWCLIVLAGISKLIQ